MSDLVFTFIIAFVVVAVFDLLAQAFGVDSRPEFEDRRAPARGLYT